MSNEAELRKKLLHDDDGEMDDIEEQKLLLKRTAATALPRRPAAARSGIPCWCKCILILFALLTAFGLAAFFATYMLVKDAVEHLTVTTPHAPFAIVDMSEPELHVVKSRVALFFDELRAGVASSPLVVTQDEINGFVGHSDYLRGNMYITLEPGLIQEDYSLPTYMLPGGKGRYFVGEDHLSLDTEKGTVEVAMETAAKHHNWFDGPLLFAQLSYLVESHNDGTSMLELFLENGSVFGLEASEDFIAQRQNLLEKLYEDPECDDARAVLNGIEGVSIEHGKITIMPRKVELN